MFEKFIVQLMNKSEFLFISKETLFSTKGKLINSFQTPKILEYVKVVCINVLTSI